ncbi:6-hydroxymethylpterin diphosphokinase MptE-like protein [Pseudomonadota bacterium]
MTNSEGIVEPTKEELRERNLQWFESQFPGLWHQLQSYKPMSELVDEGDGWYNLSFSGGMLYEPSAKECIEGQLSDFRERPRRLLMQPMQPHAFDRYASNFLHSFIERVSAEGCEFSTFVPSPKSYYLIVMGVGLGAHLEELVERTDCQALILFEPNIEFLVQSLDVFDWQKLHDTMEARGGYLNVLVSDQQDEIFLRLKSDIRLTNPCSFDGTALFTNYNNIVFQVITERIYKDVSLILSGLGFYFDETVMLANTHANLCDGDAQMVRFNRGKIRSHPAFIVASGPSLDKDIEWIKANQDKAVIFACGSAILPLLRNGIQPDFTVEIENIPELYPMIIDTVKYVDISKVHLLATTTIDPRVPEFFDQTSYYFRPALSSYPVFARS